MLKGQKQIYNVNTYQKKAGMAILTSEKVNLRTGNTVRDVRIFHNYKAINTSRRYEKN